jgi:methylase of polypeptide subunit release factors
LLEPCVRAELLAPVEASDGKLWTSRLRYSTLPSPQAELMLVHSAFPTNDNHSVFFGPDSYRFANFLRDRAVPAGRMVDIGCGTGVGGLVLAKHAQSIVFSDVNPVALELAAVNAALAGVGPATISFVESDVLVGVEGPIDLVIANPPYLVDDAARLYRDGGGDLGVDLALRIIKESLTRLSAGGRLLLFTATPVVDGRNVLAVRVREISVQRTTSWSWQEIDPDVFGEELDRPAYRDVERLAVVSLMMVVD